MQIDQVRNRKVVKGKAISLYSGAGGMDIGFHMAGYDVVWANEINKDAANTYRSLFPNNEITCGDILDQKIPDISDLDLIIGGPPCQGFSVAGKMDPSDPRSKHVWNFLGVVKKLRPKKFVMENVKALGFNSRWSALREKLIRCSEELGYKSSIYVLNAADYGVPQGRERMFLVGSLSGEEKPKPPKSVSKSKKRVIRDVLNGLPKYGEVGNDLICTAKITPAKNPILRKSPFAGMLFNGQGRPLDVNTISLTLPASMGGNRTPILDQLQINEDLEPWVVGYHERLMKGRGPVKRAPRHLRRLTVQEASGIQTFPKEINFEGSLTSKFKQIGNAVPPLLAYHVAKSLD